MNNEEISKKTTAPSAQVDFTKSVALSGVTEMVSSTDKIFIAKAGEGLITVTGEGLNPKLIDVEKNVAILGGRISSVSYGKQTTAKGLLSKLFK